MKRRRRELLGDVETVELPREAAEELRRLTMATDLTEAITSLLMDLKTYVTAYDKARDLVEQVREMEREFADERSWILFRGKLARLISTIARAAKLQVEEADATILRMYAGEDPGLEQKLRYIESRLRVIEMAEELAVETVREIFRYLRELAREERRRLLKP